MAPAIKELSRWLDANSEYSVAPDWADVVKHSVSPTYSVQKETDTEATCEYVVCSNTV